MFCVYAMLDCRGSYHLLLALLVGIEILLTSVSIVIVVVHTLVGLFRLLDPLRKQR